MTAAKADGREPQQRTRTTVYGVTEPSEYVCGEMLKSNQLNAHHFDFGCNQLQRDCAGGEAEGVRRPGRGRLCWMPAEEIRWERSQYRRTPHLGSRSTAVLPAAAGQVPSGDRGPAP